MNLRIVILLCNESDYMATPWAWAGYTVYMIDPLHQPGVHKHERLPNTFTVGAVIAPDKKMPGYPDALEIIGRLVRSNLVTFVFGFPVCTDLAASGARHWKKKQDADRYFQAKAALMLEQCRMIGSLSGAPWGFENPNGAARGIIGDYQFSFDPCDYGGYLPEDDRHPDYAQYLPPRDAYKKATNIWCGGGFAIPEKKPVPSLDYYPGWKKLGGKSEKTKRIRSATPRGFVQAVFEANHKAASIAIAA